MKSFGISFSVVQYYHVLFVCDGFFFFWFIFLDITYHFFPNLKIVTSETVSPLLISIVCFHK